MFLAAKDLGTIFFVLWRTEVAVNVKAKTVSLTVILFHVHFMKSDAYVKPPHL